MQLDQRDKELDKRDQLFSDHLAQHLKAGSPSQATEEVSLVLFQTVYARPSGG